MYIILIDLGGMKLYSVLRMLSHICTQSPYPFFTTPSIYQIYLCIHLLYTYVMPCHCHIYVYNIIVWRGCTKLI